MWFREQSGGAGRTPVNRRLRVRREPLLAVNARAQEQSRVRLRRVRALTVLGVALAGCAAVAYFGGQWVYDELFAWNPLFTVQVLDIRTDGLLQPADIRAHYGLAPGMNLFAVALGRMHADLLKTPEVRSVELRRQLPGTLSVRINERQPIARLPGQTLVLDREGYVFRFKPAMAALPLITGWSLPGLPASGRIADPLVADALALLELCAQPRWSSLRPQTLDVAQPDYLELRLAGGERVRLGRTRLADRLNQLAEIQKAQAARGQPLQFVDLSMDRNVPGQPAPPAGAEGWR